jgi:AraC family transcriptional regulator
MAQLRSDVRYQGSLVSITDVSCRPSSCRLGGEEHAETPEIVFPRVGVFVRRTGRAEIVADANHVLFFNGQEVYRVSHPILAGDDCSSFVFLPDVVAEALHLHHRVIRADPQRPYRLGHGLLRLQTVARLQHLRQRLNSPLTTGLEVEERALELLNHVLADIGGQPTARYRQRTDTVRMHRRWSERVKLLLAMQPEAKLSLTEIAGKVYCSPFHLSRIFHATVGSSIHQYQLRLRLALALERLADGSENLTELGLALGFSSHSHFTAAFQKAFGLSPSSFQRATTPQRMRKLSKILKASFSMASHTC